MTKLRSVAIVTVVAAVITLLVPRVTHADCTRYHRGLESLIRRSELAMDGRPYHVQAMKKWRAAAPACRDGRWYVSGSRILRWGSGAPLIAGNTKLTSADQALSLGLRRDRSDPVLLAFVAFTSALRAKAPRLPGDACSLVKGASHDRREYICGHVARAKHDWAGAKRHFSAVKRASSFPDLYLRCAEALSHLGKRRAARKAARRALRVSEVRARGFGATRSEYRTMHKAARRLAR